MRIAFLFLALLFCSTVKSERQPAGMQQFVVAPHPCGELTHCKGMLDTAFGQIVSEWTVSDSTLTLDIQVPPNATATLVFPEWHGHQRVPQQLHSGRHQFSIH